MIYLIDGSDIVKKKYSWFDGDEFVGKKDMFTRIFKVISKAATYNHCWVKHLDD